MSPRRANLWWPFGTSARRERPTPSEPVPAVESEDSKRRRGLGARFLAGDGFEIGPGLTSTRLPRARTVTLVDRRSRSELAAVLGADLPHDVISPDEAARRHPAGRDFVVAHQMLHRSENPIRILLTWLRLLRQDGVLFLSLPSADHACERDRAPTPIEHILDDYYLDRDEAAYESRQHILSSIVQRVLYEPTSIWYAQEGLERFARVSLTEVRRTGHDVHWHTYSATVAAQVIEAAFYLDGAGVEWIHREEIEGNLYLICRRRVGAKPAAPECLIAYRQRIVKVMERLTS